VRQSRRVAVGPQRPHELQQRWSTATVAAAASAAAASNKVAAAALSKQACVRAVPARPRLELESLQQPCQRTHA